MKIVYAVGFHMVLELVGNIYIVCLMNQVFGEAAKKFLQIMYVNIGEIQNKNEVLSGEDMTEKEREEAIRYIMSQLEDGYIDLGLHEQNELVVIKEAMDMLRIVDKWNSIPLN